MDRSCLESHVHPELPALFLPKATQNVYWTCAPCNQLESWKEGVILSALLTDAGYFMYFDTSSGNAEEVAVLESRILYPKRTQQCLQFFYKMSGSSSDKLVIWTKEDDGTGNVRKTRKIETFQGKSINVRKTKNLEGEKIGSEIRTFSLSYQASILQFR